MPNNLFTLELFSMGLEPDVPPVEDPCDMTEKFSLLEADVDGF